VAQVLPDVLDGVQLRRSRGQEDKRDVLRGDEVASGVPAGAVEQQNGVSALGDDEGDLVQVELHGLGIGVGQRQRRACAARWTDRAEEVGALIALVGRLARPRPASRPLSDDPVLLADAGLVLEPDLDRLALGDAGQMSLQRRGKVFLNAAMVCPS
jgi:hypothetical protein